MKNAYVFDFKRNCFICGNICYKKHDVKMVKKNDTVDNIKNIINSRDNYDKIYKEWLARLKVCNDLVKAEGRYHSTSVIKFYAKKRDNLFFNWDARHLKSQIIL